jgi:hypothetical protein
MTVQFKDFRGTFTSWTALFEKAAAFANQIEPERLISISHSEDENSGVVVVWYWSDEAAGGDFETR